MLKFKNGIEVFREVTGDNVEIMISGDFCPRHKGQEMIESGRIDEVVSEITPLVSSSDLSIVQFETPLINKDEGIPIPKTGPNIKVIPESLEMIKAFGFDVALLANNHIGDFGAKPVIDTIELLNNAGIKTVGAGNDLEDAKKPLKFVINNLNITIVNVAEHEYGTATINTAGGNPLNVSENIIDIIKLKKECDVLLVIVHGGNEYLSIPSPRMKSTYRAFADAGADAVINIHTHCPQGVELWNDTPIIYSLGNFYFPALNPEKVQSSMWFTGYSVKLVFDKKGACSIKIYPHTFKDDRGSRLKLLKKDDFTRFCNYLAEISEIINDDDKANKYYDAWCTIKGDVFIPYLTEMLGAYPVDYNDEEQWKKLLGPRNIHTCETHNELLTNFLRMIEEKRVQEAKKYIPEMKRLQDDSLIFG